MWLLSDQTLKPTQVDEPFPSLGVEKVLTYLPLEWEDMLSLSGQHIFTL